MTIFSEAVETPEEHHSVVTLLRNKTPEVAVITVITAITAELLE